MLRVPIYGLLRACRMALLLSIALAWVTQMAHAAQITVLNCVDKEIKLCAFDNKTLPARANVRAAYTLKRLERGTFQCHSRCAFMISHPNDSWCVNAGTYINHMWGSGNYRLIALEKTTDSDDQPSYKSSNLQEGNITRCPPLSTSTD
jgi:hypothetical protein